MSLKETLENKLADLNISHLMIDKDTTTHGEPAVQIAFFMDNPAGMDTGKLEFEIFFRKNMSLSHDDMADLTHSYALNQAKVLVMEEEVE